MEATREQPDIERGLLEIFRAFVLFIAGLALAHNVLYGMLNGSWRLEDFIPISGPAALLAYLHWGWARRALGKRYLALALIAAGITVVMQNLSYGNSSLPVLFSNIDQASVVVTPEIVLRMFTFAASLISPPLFILLVFVSWQYSFRGVALYLVGISALDLVVHAQIESANSGIYLPIASALLFRNIAFLAVGYIITRLMLVQRQQRAALAQANLKLTSYAAMIESLTLSRERNRIGRELHDTLAHTLSAASVQLEAADSLWDSNHSKAHELVLRVLASTRSGLIETRRALHALRASPLDDIGLRLALHELGVLTEQRCGCIVTLQLPDALPPLSADVEHTLYRVAQEAIENVVQHAQAAHLQMVIRHDKTHIRLRIMDDGVGFKPETRALEGHYGIQGMTERVQALGGSVHLASRLGVGTTLTVELPAMPSTL